MTPTATLPYAFMAYTGATLHLPTQMVQTWGGKMVSEVFHHYVSMYWGLGVSERGNKMLVIIVSNSTFECIQFNFCNVHGP
jgi:hypothetical protein